MSEDDRVTQLVSTERLGKLDDGALAELRDRLGDHGYDARLLGRAEEILPRQLDRIRLPLVRAWLEQQGTPASTLALLFAYRGAVSQPAAREALGDDLVAALEQAGVLDIDREQDAVSARCLLTPFEGMWIAADPFTDAHDVVMGPGQTTVELAQAMEVEPSDRVLDLGCGAGSLALAAARRGAEHVVGTDVSARAVALAQFNARLNGEEVTFREGDLAEPVRGERFDRVVSQPPFVIQPHGRAATTWLHGGSRGDEIAMRLVGQLPSLLEVGGRALLRIDVVDEQAPLSQRLARALGDEDFSVAALRTASADADQQASGYAALADPALGVRYAEVAREYRAHLEQLGADSFSRALVLLRREHPDTTPWNTTLAVPRLARCQADRIATLERALDAAVQPPEQLREQRVSLPEGAMVVTMRPFEQGRGEAHHTMRVPKGLIGEHELSEAALLLLESLKERPAVGEAIGAFAQAVGAREDEVADKVIDFVRQSLASGLLEADSG